MENRPSSLLTRWVQSTTWQMPLLLISVGLLTVAEWSLPSMLMDPADPLTVGDRAVAYRLSENLDRMKVFFEGPDGNLREMRRKGTVFSDRHLPSWNWVGPVQARVDLPREPKGPYLDVPTLNDAEMVCLWAHPLNKGPLILRFPEVPLGGTFVGSFHLRSSADPKARARFKVRLGDRVLVKKDISTKPGSVQEVSATLPGEGVGDLEIELETVKKGKNHLCIDGLVFVKPDEVTP